MSKYHAKPQRENGRYYASTAERDYHRELMLREQCGDVRDIEVQPKVLLYAGISYRPDYSFYERGMKADSWRKVWVDVKGVQTREFQLKVKLWRVSGPGPLKIVQRRGKRSPFVTLREVLPK